MSTLTTSSLIPARTATFANAFATVADTARWGDVAVMVIVTVLGSTSTAAALATSAGATPAAIAASRRAVGAANSAR